MALCVVNSNGALVESPVIDGVCSGIWLVTPEDKVTFLERVFDPAYLSSDDYQALFLTGLTLPLICYLTAWGFGQVIHFLNNR